METGQAIVTLAYTIREEDALTSGMGQAHDFIAKLLAWAETQPEMRWQKLLHADYATRAEHGNPLVHIRTLTTNADSLAGNWNAYHRFDAAHVSSLSETPDERSRFLAVFRLNDTLRACAPRVVPSEEFRTKVKRTMMEAFSNVEREAMNKILRSILEEFEGMEEDGVLDSTLYEGAYGDERINREVV